MTPTRVPARWSHFLHLQPYRRGNSPEGIRLAANAPAGRRAIDLDFQPSRSGALLNTHWAHPKREGFRHTTGRRAGRVPHLPFRLLRTSTALRLQTRDGYRIQTAHSAIWDASRHRVRIEAEMKAVPSLAALRRLAAYAEAYYGADWQQWVQVKMLASFRWRTTLRRAKRAGFITFLIGLHDRDVDPNTLPDYVDHYRW